ncbi:MAG: hypothetical protein WCJ68_07920 [Chitinophagia bacterium]
MKVKFKKVLFYIFPVLLSIILIVSNKKFDKKNITLNKLIPKIEYVVHPVNDKLSNVYVRKIKNVTNYQAFLKSNQELTIIEEKRGEQNKALEQDGPDKAFEQDFYRTMNLDLKRPTPELLPDIINQNYFKLKSNNKAFAIPGSSSSAPWVELGPNNVGGRTRALTWDPNDSSGKKVWAGGVGGGLWFNNDITNSASVWNKVDDFWQSLSINKIVFDTLDKKVAYVTTGEGYGAAASIGAGIWKTTNGGVSWSQLTSTKNFLYSNDMVIRHENSETVVYAAIDANYYMGKFTNTENLGLYRSEDNGSTWTQTLPIIDSSNKYLVPFVPASIQISKNNTIWVGTKQSPISNANRGGGYILKSLNGMDWVVVKKINVGNGYGRVTIAVAPSNEKIIYAYVENYGRLENLYRSDDEGLTWTTLSKPIDADIGVPSNDFTRGQAWYDQSLAVDPNNPNVVIVGGIDLFKTIDGGITWSQIGKWYNWNAKYSYVHADQHVVSYKPGSSNTALFGNDGGVFYTTNLQNADTLNVINSRNNGYNVTQFYAAAIHPNAGKNFFLAGAQDNGTQKFLSPTFSASKEVTSGDGAFCFIDQTNPKYQISSSKYNTYFLSTDSGVSFSIKLIDTILGSFINPASYDPIQHILYSNSSSNYLVRVKNITGTPNMENVSVPNLINQVTALRVSPYNHLSTTIFLGTNFGQLLKVVNADSIPSSTLIGGASFPAGSISCIEIGASENELLVTFFNYGSKKIWYTSDGGKNWVDKMGNFPDIPVRWALFNPNKMLSQVILATELGVYATNNFETASPTWAQSNNGFSNVRTDMLQLRSADYAVIAATHGRGLFFNSSFSEAKPPEIISFTPKIGLNGTKISIKGTNFLNASEVRFGGLPALSFKVEADTLITAVVGIAFPGYVNVKTTGGIAALSGFSTSPPKLNSFLPKSGGNGIPITISGTNLTDITKVIIGGRVVKSFTVESSSTISTIIPDSTTNGNVVISNDFYTDSLTGFVTCATPTLSKINDTSFCNGNVLQISASSASQYQWLNNNTSIANAINQSFKIVTTGTYQVKTTDNSCSALSNPFKVTVNALPTAPIVKDTFYCQNSNITDTFKVGFSTGNTLLWYGIDTVGAAASSIIPKPNSANIGFQNFYVSQKNTKTGCEGSKSKIIVEIRPIPATPLIFRDTSNYLVSNVALKSLWYKDGVTLNDTTQKLKPNLAGSYSVKSSTLGCNSVMSAAYYYLVTDIVNLSQDEFIKLAPNPFVNHLNFDFVVKGYQKLNMEAFDLASGTKVLSMPNLTPGIPIYVGQLSAGTYLIRVASNDGKINYQFKMVKL